MIPITVPYWLSLLKACAISASLITQYCMREKGNIFQEHNFLRDYIVRPYFHCYETGKKRAGFSNPVKNRVLESRSNTFSPLDDANIFYCSNVQWKLIYAANAVVVSFETIICS